MPSTVYDGHAGAWGEMPRSATNKLHADAAIGTAVQIQRRLRGLLPSGLLLQGITAPHAGGGARRGVTGSG